MKYLFICLFVIVSYFGLSQNSGINEDKGGIIYFSTDNGTTWQNKSSGFPDNVFITDMAVSDSLLGVSTKQDGIFLFNFKKSSWENVPTRPQITNNMDALFFFKNKFYAGTQNGGIYVSADMGKIWHATNKGLANLTIRKFAAFYNKLYAATNGGLFSLNDKENSWELEYGEKGLQVNGITEFAGEIYIGTNRGAFKLSKQTNTWKQIMSNSSLHNISADDHAVYGMVYNELFQSSDKGDTWQSLQSGLPDKLYTFQVMKNDNVILAGQWNGVYKMKNTGPPLYLNSRWEFASNGLPSKFSVTEMKIFKNMIVIGCSERGFHDGSNNMACVEEN